MNSIRQSVFLFLSSWLSLTAWGQAEQPSLRDNADWQQQVELLMDFDDEESSEAWEQQMELLSDLHEQKIDLSTATREDLEQLPFLSAEQVEQICEYLYRYGPMQSLAELAMIESLDPATRRLLREFVKLPTSQIPTPRTPTPNLPSVANGGFAPLGGAAATSVAALKTPVARGEESRDTLSANNSSIKANRAPLPSGGDGGGLLFTSRLPFYKRQGDRNGYLGYPYRHTLRFTMNLNRHLRFGLVGAQDSGEPFFANRNSLGYDHYALYAQLRRMGRLKNLVIGHYRLRLGLGLVMNGHMNLGKRAMLDGVGRSTTTITPHASRMSANYLQGAAATVSLSRSLSLTAFASWRKRDATLRGDTAISTLLTSGYHRTPSEMERKNNVSEWLAGTRLVWQYDRWHAGLTALANGFDKPLQPVSGEQASPAQRYREIFPEGKSFRNVSIDYGYQGRRFAVSGETAMDKDGALATLNTLIFRPVPRLRLMAVQRFYSYRYEAPHAASFGEGSRVQNESGILVGASWQASRQLQLLAYTDYVYFPWARYQASQSSHATDHLAEVRWQYRQWRFFARYRLRCIEENDHAELATGEGLPALIDHQQHRLRLSAGYDFGRFTTRTQLDAALSHKHESSKGWMLGQTVDMRLRRLIMSAHVAYFHTDDYDSRLYSYERNLRYAFSFPAYYGHGLHGALYGSYTINRHLTLTAKLSSTHYFDRSTIGTALQQIDSRTQTDLDVQLSWKL